MRHLCRSLVCVCVVTSSIKLPSSSDSELAWLLGRLLSYSAYSCRLVMKSTKKLRMPLSCSVTCYASLGLVSTLCRASSRLFICLLVGSSALGLSVKT